MEFTGFGFGLLISTIPVAKRCRADSPLTRTLPYLTPRAPPFFHSSILPSPTNECQLIAHYTFIAQIYCPFNRYHHIIISRDFISISLARQHIQQDPLPYVNPPQTNPPHLLQTKQAKLPDYHSTTSLPVPRKHDLGHNFCPSGLVSHSASHSSLYHKARDNNGQTGG